MPCYVCNRTTGMTGNIRVVNIQGGFKGRIRDSERRVVLEYA